MIFAPRSCPSRPGLATKMRSFESGMGNIYSKDELVGLSFERAAIQTAMHPAHGKSRGLEEGNQLGKWMVANVVRPGKNSTVRECQPPGPGIDARCRVELARFGQMAPVWEATFKRRLGRIRQTLKRDRL